MVRARSYLELEQRLELGLHFPGVGSASPMAGQIVRVCKGFQHGQLRFKGSPWLHNQASAGGQHNAKRGCPPTLMYISHCQLGFCLKLTVWQENPRNMVSKKLPA